MSRTRKTGKSRSKSARSPRGAEAAESRAQAEHLIGLYRAGRWQAGYEGAQQFTQRWPGLAVGWNLLGACAQGLGHIDEASRAYQRAAKLEPDNPGTRNNLGLMLIEQARFDEAVRACRAALKRKPDFVEARFNLALAQERAGATVAAEQTYQELLQQQPDLAEAHNRLGNLLLQQDREPEALACYRQAVSIDANNAGFHANLGNALARAGQLDEAESIYRHALQLQPDDLELHNNLGNLLKRRGHLAEAERVARTGLERAPDRTDLLTQLAGTLQELGRIDEAIELCRRAAAAAPDDAEVHNAFANALADGGYFDAADAAYRHALELRPGWAEAIYYRAILRRPAEPAAMLCEVETLLANDPPATEGAALHYAAGKLSADAQMQPEHIFAHYREGARLQRRQLDYDIEADERYLAAIADAFPRERIDALAPGGHTSDAPLFIVGMPRSGTSLIEQILASHSRVHGAGERRDLGRIVADCDDRFGSAFPDWVARMDTTAAADIGRAYCARVIDPVSDIASDIATDTQRVTDKLPANFACCGLIAAALPHARIVHVRRDPVDTCLSCFSYRFAGRQAFSYDLTELGRYYRAYHGLMAHWRAVLTDAQWLEIDYETLVAQPHAVVARLLEYAGLEWEDACLDFHRTQRAVRTASADQVRQPLYQSAVGRWRAFAPQLQPLLEALGPLAPDARNHDNDHASTP